jgi:ribosomal protein S18 acetylase RimI-like enzyme
VEGARPAVDSDVPRLVVLGRQAVAELAPMRGGELWSARDARAEPLDDAFPELLAHDDVCIVAGTIDDVVVGFGVGRLEPLRDGRLLGVIDELFVEPEARSIGVGDAVVEELLRFFTAHGCIGADALALPGNRATKNFFEQHGFVARSLVMHRSLGSECSLPQDDS